MSFRRTVNRHDQWQNYCRQHAAVVRSTGLPPEMFSRAEILEDFLVKGHFCGPMGKGTDINVSDLSDTAFLALEEVVNGYFDFQQRYSSFGAERWRRFKRHG